MANPCHPGSRRTGYGWQKYSPDCRLCFLRSACHRRSQQNRICLASGRYDSGGREGQNGTGSDRPAIPDAFRTRRACYLLSGYQQDKVWNGRYRCRGEWFSWRAVFQDTIQGKTPADEPKPKAFDPTSLTPIRYPFTWPVAGQGKPEPGPI